MSPSPFLAEIPRRLVSRESQLQTGTLTTTAKVEGPKILCVRGVKNLPDD